jgi:hypothetical protein
VLLSFARSRDEFASIDVDAKTLVVPGCFGAVKGEKVGNGDLNLGAAPPPKMVLGRVPPPNGALVDDLTAANGDVAAANAEKPF